MGVEFNTGHSELNPKNVKPNQPVAGKTANTSIFGSESKQNGTNEYRSIYDVNFDEIVSVKEQMASIADQIKDVRDSSIARFFNDDLSYAKNNEESVKQVDELVKDRQNNALEYIEYAKSNGVDISKKKSKEVQQHLITSNSGEKDTVLQYSKGNYGIYTPEGLALKTVTQYGSHDLAKTYHYNSDGSYSYDVKVHEGYGWTNVQVDKNENMIENTGFYTTARGDVKAYAQDGDETAEQTLTRLGITDPADRAAVMKANPKAAKKGYFRTDTNDVYIPKAVIENMQKNNRLDEDKLAGKPQA